MLAAILAVNVILILHHKWSNPTSSEASILLLLHALGPFLDLTVPPGAVVGMGQGHRHIQLHSAAHPECGVPEGPS